MVVTVDAGIAVAPAASSVVSIAPISLRRALALEVVRITQATL
jgi:hypothetical protein